MTQNAAMEDPNDFPFDIVIGDNGDVCLALPVLDSVPDANEAVLKFDHQALQCKDDWVEFLLCRAKDQKEVKLMIDYDTAVKIVHRPEEHETIVVAETDAETGTVGYLYEASVRSKGA